MTEQQSYEGWAIVELFGRNMIAGHVSEQQIGGASFVRVDVPATAAQPAFTKFFGAQAIYGITPTTEEIARAAAARLHTRPVECWVVPIQRQLPSQEDFFEADENEGEKTSESGFSG